ncbi:MAG: sodium:proton exchanger [Candidatus Komeilibacteria bacterium CG11_big_fil_rev_8_21_14_0_20_36_20]|uniref:Sodium:proton exchanger n=1 Tax=Candidatus Komeilibacteria bacterium CG11_big_fil_rev_8_21_14_0_20_36_20 TaxID=1974477 RepID=A0A2H0NCS6_9BACT|nr:MAG: sodium:proton exchanger [Candidatus Komeilibacteria bacterium CG11_big_fil_rev_8_21_14_0_20_36_20]PIR81518.1 MAG: sodium:proton exchanger [Candidatus Komeilibacteria bacterium CG10_big_fil_rev_8_21_14_0_10_36_65]PJC55706.1 MAG: sodium:proton exchanger [Candidatus Komeilibacteria bacterium CG_4_9_14_0_2_um_filter_36_13]
MLTYTLFVVGFYFLIKGASWLVTGASSIAKKRNVSDLVIGLTIVAFGTSAPELIVNLFASFNGSSDLAIGNIIGSNISNILLILGIAAIIYPLSVKEGTVLKEIPLNLLSVMVLWLLVNDKLIDNSSFSSLTRIDGGIMLLFFVIFLYYTFGISKVEGESDRVQKHSGWVSAAMIVGGMIGLALGGQWIVDGAIVIVQKFGMSESLIGLTVVAVGTSLPELATSAVAAWKHKADIAIGNIIGSNIFNIFWILGLSAVIKPLVFSPMLNFDIYFMAIVTVLLFIFMFVGRKNVLQRWQGIILLGIYVVYVGYLIYRG